MAFTQFCVKFLGLIQLVQEPSLPILTFGRALLDEEILIFAHMTATVALLFLGSREGGREGLLLVPLLPPLRPQSDSASDARVAAAAAAELARMTTTLRGSSDGINGGVTRDGAE